MSRAVDAFIVALILLNVAAFVAETVPRLAQEYGAWFRTFEFVSVAVFTVEYVLRLWVAVEVPFLSRLPAWKARLTFASRGPQIIDLLAILLFYLGELLAIDLRVLRVLRLLRFLKLSRYSPAMHALIRVLHAERRALAGALLLLCAAVLFASTGIYYLESQAQPDKFGSVPDAAWWAIATLTTVGYGDVTPVTPLGRLFGSLVMVLGLCILALPVAIISTGFAQEASRRDFVVTWSLVSRVPLLAELDARDVARIMPLLQAHNLPPNIEVVPAGSPGTAMYFIAAGKVWARRGRRPGVRDRRFFRGRGDGRERAQPRLVRDVRQVPPAQTAQGGLCPIGGGKPDHRASHPRGGRGPVRATVGIVLDRIRSTSRGCWYTVCQQLRRRSAVRRHARSAEGRTARTTRGGHPSEASHGRRPMKIHEFQAKHLLGRFDFPVPLGQVATTPAEAEGIARRSAASGTP